MEERTGGARAGPWALDWGQAATGRLRGGLVGPSHSPARSAPWREAPASTIKRAPPRPCRAGSTARGAGQGRFPHRVFDPDAPCAQLPVHGCSDGDVGGAAGDLVVGAGPWARIAPGGGSRGRRGPAGPARRPLTGWPRASVVFRGPSRPRSEAAPIVDARWWPIRAPSCPGGSSRWITPGLARPGRRCPLALPSAAPSEPVRPRGRPPVSKGPTSEVDGLGRTPVPRAGTRRRSRPGPSHNSR